jgi:hypothetical protein
MRKSVLPMPWTEKWRWPFDGREIAFEQDVVEGGDEPARERRIIVAVAITVLLGAFLWAGTEPRAPRMDFDYLWVAGTAAAQRHDPYQAVERAIEEGQVRRPFFYPGPAALWLAPFGLLPLRLAFPVWAALGVGLLAYGITRAGWWRLGILASAPLWITLTYGQTSAWTSAAAVLPWLGFLYAAKPSVGLALWAAWPTRRALIAAVLLLVLSFGWLSGWPQAWWAAVHTAPQYLAPIRRPFGWILLLGWLRWRSPGGRLIGALALIPHTTSLYEMLPLLLLARTWRELAALVGLGWVAYYGIYTHTPRSPADVPHNLLVQWPYILSLCYLPALALVLWRGRLAPAAT